jgi:hypothetical protein
VTGLEAVELALGIAALVLVLVELVRERYVLLAWAVLFIAIVQVLERLSTL